MADQKRWFKVWTTLATDPAFIDSNLSDIGRWILLGSWVAEHGNNGMITASENAFRKRLRIDNGDDTKSVILRLPNIEFLDAQNVHPNDNKMITKVITKVKSEVPFEEGKKDNDKFTVIIKNWAKYQKDSTSYERLKRWRKKQNDNGVRGEEKRREEKSIYIYSDKFEKLWEKYPAKDGKKAAIKHFIATVKNDDDVRDINRALDNYLSHLKEESWKIPKNGSTWFNIWRDWLELNQPKSWRDA